MDMQQVTRTAAETSGIQGHSQQNPQYLLNEGSLQHVVGLPSTSALNIRPPLGHRRGPSDLDAFRASFQHSPLLRHTHPAPPGFRTHHSMNQTTNFPLQSPTLPPAVQQQSLNTYGLASGNFANHRSQSQSSIPAQFLRPLPPAQANSLPSMDNTRVARTERLRSMASGVPSPLPRADNLPEHPSDQNWRPTGRMRGSLTGSDYSAVISHYMAPSTPSTAAAAAARAPLSSQARSASDQVSVLIANNLMAHGAGNHQANFSQDNLSAQQGDSRI